MAELTERHEQLAADSHWDFSDLSALFINCTLKRSPEVSNTAGLADLAVAIMERSGVAVGVVRAVDHEIATGVWPAVPVKTQSKFLTISVVTRLSKLPRFLPRSLLYTAANRSQLNSPSPGNGHSLMK